MIEGFEDITYDLTDQEKEMIPTFLKGLKSKIGSDKAVTSQHIIDKLPNFKLTGARVRKIINYIRNAYLLPGLIATSKGYYISRDREEVAKYIESLKGREAAIQMIRIKTEEYLKQLK